MLIGVLSDTHDKLPATRQAVESLLRLGCVELIHCGDLCSRAVLDLLAGDVPVAFVFGNNDFDRDDLRSYGEHLGLNCLGTHGVLEVGGKKLGVAHGDRSGPIDELLETPGLAYLFSGHTHVADDHTEGGVRWVNPGALSRTRRPSVAVVDLGMGVGVAEAVAFHGV